jgi:hypothetical protein
MENKMYYVVMTLIGGACITLGWDSIDGVPLFQLALIVGGSVLGHVLTECLNEGEDE